MKFIITVDTEADNQWRGGEGLTLNNLAAIPRFQTLCEKYGFPPTYLITHEIAVSDEGIRVLKPLQDVGRAEIGTHFHPWTTPPFFDEREEKRLMHFPCELSDEYLRKKFVSLHETVAERFGRPTSFRAGRWGYDARVGALLEEFCYTADCSITPLINWRRAIRGDALRKLPDFLTETPFPYMPFENLVEIPVTILPKDTTLISRMGARLLGRGSFRVRWCRIFPDTTMNDLRTLVYRATRMKLPYLEFMVHSSEFVVGGSPYSKTEEHITHFFGVFEEFLNMLKAQSIEGIMLRDAAQEYKGHFILRKK